ncbi:MAG: hypothetical protein K1X89_18770 [Myxococcaceae bacterium]|nr:hypothetical protein [Myxococcaceae bacterium]
MRWLCGVLVLAACGRSGVYGAPTLLPAADAGRQGPRALGTCSNACTSAPPGVLDTAAGGVVLHWETCRGCVAVTVDPRLETTPAEVDRAAAVWVTGTLCFKPARLDGTIPTVKDDARLHLAALDPTGPGQPYFSNSTINYLQSNGAIINAAAMAALDYPLTPRHLIQLVGRGIGYRAVSDGSVMNETVEGPAALTDADRAVHQKLYGAPPWCER